MPTYHLRSENVEEDVGVVGFLPPAEGELQSVPIRLESLEGPGTVDVSIDSEFVVSLHQPWKS